MFSKAHIALDGTDGEEAVTAGGSERKVRLNSLLTAAAHGDSTAAEELFPLVYEGLRALAHSYFRNQPLDHTLQPTALVHEVFMKLFEGQVLQARDRAHFFALAARAMRQILANHARDKSRLKRGAGWTQITLDQVMVPPAAHTLDLLHFDEVLTRLGGYSERSAQLVELRLFGGLSCEEAADVLGVSRTSVAREWRFARSWLATQLSTVH